MGKFLGTQSLLQGSLRKSGTFAEKLTATNLSTTHCQKRDDLSKQLSTLKPSFTHWTFHMFWIAFLGLVFSWMLIKLSFLSATAGILNFVVKLLLFVIVAGLIAAAWFWIRKKSTGTASQN